jgi:hypothetical protein
VAGTPAPTGAALGDRVRAGEGVSVPRLLPPPPRPPVAATRPAAPAGRRHRTPFHSFTAAPTQQLHETTELQTAVHRQTTAARRAFVAWGLAISEGAAAAAAAATAAAQAESAEAEMRRLNGLVAVRHS